MPSAKPVLLVDENAVPRRVLAEQLAREGTYTVIEAGSAAEARAAQNYVFAIIDGALTDSEALSRGLRAQGFDGPILFLTDSERAAGEYLVKPFRFSAYLFRPGAKLLTGDGARRIRLTEKEANILKFLAAAGRTVPRETLLHEVWGYSPAVTTHTLETHIYRLRRKIEENPGRAKILVTEDGGYRLG